MGFSCSLFVKFLDTKNAYSSKMRLANEMGVKIDGWVFELLGFLINLEGFWRKNLGEYVILCMVELVS